VRLVRERPALLRDSAGPAPFEREALKILGIRTARQLETFDDAAAIGLAKLLRFAEWRGLTKPGELTAEVRRIEAQYGKPFRQTDVIAMLAPLAQMPGSFVTAQQLSTVNVTFEGTGERWLELWRPRLAHLYARALPDPLRPLAERIQTTTGGRARIEAIQEFARNAGKHYTGGRPTKHNAEAAREAYLSAKRRGERDKAATIAAMQAGGFKSPSRVYELRKLQRWDDAI